jgi:hypothetical protein
MAIDVLLYGGGWQYKTETLEAHLVTQPNEDGSSRWFPTSADLLALSSGYDVVRPIRSWQEIVTTTVEVLRSSGSQLRSLALAGHYSEDDGLYFEGVLDEYGISFASQNPLTLATLTNLAPYLGVRSNAEVSLRSMMIRNGTVILYGCNTGHLELRRMKRGGPYFRIAPALQFGLAKMLGDWRVGGFSRFLQIRCIVSGDGESIATRGFLRLEPSEKRKPPPRRRAETNLEYLQRQGYRRRFRDIAPDSWYPR